MSEIPPDLPAGTWEAACNVKKSKTSKDSYPMLVLEWRTTEALTDGNEDYVGGRVSDFVVFFPNTHKASRMSKIRLKKMCEALDIEIPSITKITSWDDLSGFINCLEGLKATIYTTVEERKDTGELVAKVRYDAPGSSFAMKASAADDDDDEEEEEEEEEKPRAKILKKKKLAR
jgi:hypothetical protein